MKLVVTAVSAAVVLSALPTVAVAAGPPDARVVASVPKAVVRASAKEATEGDRMTFRVRVPRAKDAKRVVLQERVFGYYTTTWNDVSDKRARARLTFRTTVTAQNEAVYRVAVTYAGRTKPVVSKPVKLVVWRWVPLQEFSPYFQTSWAGYGEADMNGVRYEVWGGATYVASVRSWEARVTPGRNCTRFRAVLGLADSSDDGSTGVVSFAVDEAATIYQSPSLTPGMTLPVELDLAYKPYRFGMTAANTSADKVKAYPMVGNGAFYCTGIEG